jgi:hypothetical protein
MRTLLRTFSGGLLVCAILSSGNVDSYDLRTHGAITEQSFDTSQGTAGYLEDVGVAVDDVFDSQAITPLDQLAEFRNPGTTRGWMIEGSIREDDYRSHPILESLFGCNPPDNPTSPIDRSLHHFFDAQRGGVGLTLGNGLPAPDWALGLQGRGPGPDQNQFSLPDARVYQLRSLTDASRDERHRNTAKLFRALGQVLHVLQDMAQPQHTRNDPHLGCASSLAQFVAGEKSWYEVYTETRALNQPYRSRSDASRPLVLSGYAPVALQGYRDYWTNANGSGLAEFSSRNFFSAGTNLGTFYVTGPCGGLSQPVCDPQAYSTEDIDFTIPTITGEPLSGRVRFFRRDILDPLTGQLVRHVRVSSRSLWDQHLESNQRQPKFSLNTYNYDSIADVLIPRAVGYSAGFLDYFFRGKLELTFADDPSNANNRNVSLINRSADVLGPGTLTLYTDDALGQRSPVPGGTLTISGSVDPNQPAADSVSLSSDAISGDLISVFQGSLGAELLAVIGKMEDPVRVEELFRGNGDWMLRTAERIVPLGIGNGPGRVKWGDVDNTLVAQTFLAEGDMSFQVYRINRDLGSRVVPLRPNPLAAGGLAVDLAAIGPTVTISGEQPIDLGATLSLDLQVLYQQLLVTVTGQLDWNDDLSVLTGASAAVDVPVSRVFARQGQFPLAMPVPIRDDSRYDWSLLDFYANPAADVVALVLVSLRSDSDTAAVVRHDPTTGALVEVPNAMAVAIRPPIPDLLYFVVNLTQRTVLARTCVETAELSYQTFQPLAVVDLIINGGPQNAPDGGLSYADFDLFENPGTEEPVIGSIDTTSGVGSLSLDGFYRTDLDEAGFSNFSLSSSSTSATLSIRKRDRFGLPLPGQTLGVALDASRSETEPDPFPRMIYDMRRANGLEEAYVLVGWNLGLQSEQWLPFRWSATAGGVAPLPVFAGTTSTSDTVGFVIPSANHAATFFLEDRFDSQTFEFSQRTHLVTNQQSFVFADNLAESFILLEPNRLYNVDDLRFHRVNGTLDRLSDPRPLKAGGSSTGAYHLVGAR